MDETLKLLAVFPHPDDETLGLGPTMARYSAEGVQTFLVCATRGERGWFDSEGPDPGFEEVARIRAAELRCAAENLGIHQVSFLDYIDGNVDQTDPEGIIGRIVSHIRRIKPHIVVTFDPMGAYGHPAITLALAVHQRCTGLCRGRNFVYVNVQAPQRVFKFYYMVDSLVLVKIATEAFGGISMEVDGVTRNHVGWEDWQITTRLDNKQYLDKVHRAIHCHKSQLPGYGPLGEWSR
jgi:LmbE family N-acetylglucosaminyl deacetylase